MSSSNPSKQTKVSSQPGVKRMPSVGVTQPPITQSTPATLSRTEPTKRDLRALVWTQSKALESKEYRHQTWLLASQLHSIDTSHSRFQYKNYKPAVLPSENPKKTNTPRQQHKPNHRWK